MSMEHDDLALDLCSDSAQPRRDEICIADIDRMVRRFYGRTRQDELLGPIFDSIVSDWDAHYEKMTRFWASAVLGSRTYHGRPIEAHRFGGLSEKHFGRWIELFSQTAREVFGPQRASVFIDLGERMARSIAMRIGVQGRFAEQ